MKSKGLQLKMMAVNKLMIACKLARKTPIRQLNVSSLYFNILKSILNDKRDAISEIIGLRKLDIEDSTITLKFNKNRQFATFRLLKK